MKIILTDFNYMPILKTKFYFIKISVRENAIPKIRRKFIATQRIISRKNHDPILKFVR